MNCIHDKMATSGAAHAVTEVLVTGATSYVASHVIKRLLVDGFQVRGSVRSLANKTKNKPLMELLPEAKFKLKLVEADLLDTASWIKAVAGCSHVIHLASPFPAENPKTEDEIIKPAVEGTLAILSACKHHRIKRLVLTSSTAAVHVFMLTDRFHVDLTRLVTEEDWTDVKLAKDVYYKSKTLAEKAAWDFVAKLSDEEKFELVVLNPDLIQGPLLMGGDSASFALIKAMMNREVKLIPKFCFGIVDARDVALAHVRALTIPEAAGHRHILSTRNVWLGEIATILDREFRSQGYNIPTTNCPYPILWASSWFDKVAKRLLESSNYNTIVRVDNTRMLQVLGIAPMDVEETIIDMAYSLVERGFVKRTSKFRPRLPEI